MHAVEEKDLRLVPLDAFDTGLDCEVGSQSVVFVGLDGLGVRDLG